MRVAIVEDDPDQAALLKLYLENDAYDTYVYQTGTEAIKGFQRETFDLILLDWYLPELNGDEVLVWIREHLGWKVPVIFVTQRDCAEDLAFALDHGADDYIAKPIKRVVLMARIRAMLRRVSDVDQLNEKSAEFGHYRFDIKSHQLYVDDKFVQLTQKEFELALFLFRNTGRLLSRSHLMEHIWGHNAKVNTRTLDTHVSRLRKKLELGQENLWRLSSVYHHGYRLEQMAS